MPLLDLSQVTESLIRMLERYLRQDHIWAPDTPPSQILISGDPPDLLAEQSSNWSLGVSLYHIQEDGYHKNLPEPAGSSPPVRYREMGLNLFYLLTAYGGTRRDSERLASPYVREQRLMGLAVKAFHDYPVLDAETRIGMDDPYVFTETLRSSDDEFRLSLHPATLEELNKVWTAASVPMRLSTIYQVDVVLLQAEPPVVSPVPVLVPRIDAAPFHPVWIQATASDCAFTLPEEMRHRTMPLSPALVAVGQGFRILGAGFSGTPHRVFLGKPDWSEPSQADVTAWISGPRTDTRIDLLVGSVASGHRIVPGLYQVHVQSGGTPSNFSPLAVGPSIAPQTDSPPGMDPVSGPAGSRFTLRGGPFRGDEINTVAVYIGPRSLEPSEFSILSEDEMEVTAPSDLTPRRYMVRVMVNSVSTPPNRWFEVIA